MSRGEEEPMLREVEDKDIAQPDLCVSTGQEPRAVGATTWGLDTSMSLETVTFG